MEARIENFSSWIPYKSNWSHKEEIESLLTRSGFTILDYMEHRFQPQGFTSIWLLAESHCALHTFPEENKTYVELSSCNVDMFVHFVTHFHQKFNGRHPNE